MNAADRPSGSYSRVAIWLHWIIALAIIGNLTGGLLFDTLKDNPSTKAMAFTMIGIHKSIGLTVLVLSIARLAWRLGHPAPPLPAHMTALERFLARLTHIGFYALMLLMPLTGWAMVSTGKLPLHPLVYFGLVPVPYLPVPGSTHGLWNQSHALLGWLALGTLALHVAGALKHHYLDRDDVLARMLPLVSRKQN